MDTDISPALQARLEKIALRHGFSLETLLTNYAEAAEAAWFPGNPMQFLNSPIVLICVTDLKGDFLYVNEAVCNALGYAQAEFLEKNYEHFLHPDDIQRAHDAYSQQVETGSLQIELRLRCKTGEYRWFSWASTLDESYAYSIAFDITDKKNAEQELAALSEQNQRIMRTVFEGYMLGAMDGRILDVNQTYCDMVGYTREELLQKNVFEMDVMFNAVEIVEHAETLVNPQIPVIIETQHRHKDGHLVDIEVNNILLEDGTIACFIRDITERKHLERQLRESEQRYRGLIESQIDFVCRYTPDTVLTYVNDAYCEFFGRTPQELIGKSFTLLAPEEETEGAFARIREVLVNPAPDTRIFYTYDMTGNKHWVQWIDFGITNEAGEVVEIQAVGRDITPMMEAQEQLAEREELLTTIFENIPVMIAQGDKAGGFQYVNDYWVETLGWTVEEMQAHQNIMEEFYPDAVERQRIFQLMISGRKDWIDTRICTRKGTFLDTSWANVQLSDGRKLGIGQVVTHRVELEKQRLYAQSLEMELQKERELRALKERFVSLVAHEFRQPLAAMSTSLDFVLRYQQRISVDRAQEKLAMVQKQIKRMAVLIEDALRFSKADAQKTEFAPQMLDARQSCEHILEPIRMANTKHQQIIVTVDDGQVFADPSLLDHILTNLLTNAQKYSPAHSTISVTVTACADHWCYSVHDEGIGIPEGELAHVFDPFYRASNAKKHVGTGLGLSIVRDYVKMHGGTTDVSSVLGEGTTFTFTLPIT